jgi:hypothetical protein
VLKAWSKCGCAFVCVCVCMCVWCVSACGAVYGVMMRILLWKQSYTLSYTLGILWTQLGNKPKCTASNILNLKHLLLLFNLASTWRFKLFGLCDCSVPCITFKRTLSLHTSCVSSASHMPIKSHERQTAICFLCPLPLICFCSTGSWMTIVSCLCLSWTKWSSRTLASCSLQPRYRKGVW